MRNLLLFSFHSGFARKEKWKKWLNVQPQKFYQHWKEMIVELRKYISRRRVEVGVYGTNYSRINQMKFVEKSL